MTKSMKLNGSTALKNLKPFTSEDFYGMDAAPLPGAPAKWNRTNDKEAVELREAYGPFLGYYQVGFQDQVEEVTLVLAGENYDDRDPENLKGTVTLGFILNQGEPLSLRVGGSQVEEAGTYEGVGAVEVNRDFDSLEQVEVILNWFNELKEAGRPVDLQLLVALGWRVL